MTPEDFDRFDSRTLLFPGGDAGWHRRMMVALQPRYHHSPVYRDEVRTFEVGDNLHLRRLELAEELALGPAEWERLL